MKLLFTLVFSIALGAGEARAYINEFVVTPEYLRKTAVPIDFSVVERSPGQFSVMITIPRASARFGTATARSARIYVSASDLPPFDAKNQRVWVNAVIGEKNLQRKIELSVPKKDGPDVSRFLILPRRELARAVFYVHFDKPGYGGDIYIVPLGYFIPEKANEALVALAEPADLERWSVEATYSRSEHDIPMDANCSYRLITHTFLVGEKIDSKHPRICQITVSSLGKDPKKWDEQTQKFVRLSQGTHIAITVAAPVASYKTAESGKAGILEVEPHQIEMDSHKEAADNTAEPASPDRRGSS